MIRHILLLLMIGLVTFAIGCGGGGDSDDKGDGDKKKSTKKKEGSGSQKDDGDDEPAEVKVYKYALSDLKTGIGDHMAPLDDGRVEFAPPNGWRPRPRSEKYLIAFQRSPSKAVPRIVGRVSDAPSDSSIKDTTADNVKEYAKWLAGHVKADLKEDEELLEEVVPLVLGDNAFGRYVRAAKASTGSKVEQQILVTTRRGRMYQIDLVVFPGELPKYRDSAYAVGAGLKFSEGGESNTIDSTFGQPGEGQ